MLLGVGRTRIQQLLVETCPLLEVPDNYELRSPTSSPVKGVRPAERLIDPTSITEYQNRHLRSSGGKRWVHPKSDTPAVDPIADGGNFFYLAARLDQVLEEHQAERAAWLLAAERADEERDAIEDSLTEARRHIRKLERHLHAATTRADEETAVRRDLHNDAVQNFGPQGSQDI